MTPVDVRNDLLGYLDRLEKKDPELHAEVDFYMVSNGYETSPDHELVKTMHGIHKEVFGKEPLYPEPARYSVSSDGGRSPNTVVRASRTGPGGSPPRAYTPCTTAPKGSA